MVYTSNFSSNRGSLGPKIGSLNCNGLGNREKRDAVFEWLKNKREDIIVLQETHSTSATEGDWLRAWDGTIYFNHGSSNARGTVILVKRQAQHVEILNHVVLSQGRAHYIEFEIEGTNFCLANIYAPNNDDLNFLETVTFDLIARPRNDHLIMCGDWNTVLNNSLDKMGGSTTHANHRCQHFLNNFMNDHGFSDIFRLTHNSDKVFTHFNKKCKTASRLDFFVIEDRLVNFPICEAEVSHGYRSDHSYISLSIQGSAIEHGRGYWKLNNSHLDDTNFVEGVREIIRGTSDENFDSFRGLWDVIKFKIKDLAIRYGKDKKKKTSREKENLKKEIDRIKNIDDFIKKDDLRKEMFEAEARLNDIISSEMRGNITRARARWTEQGERSTKYFFGLERSNAKKKSITKISCPHSGMIYDQQGISNHVVKFYQNLFTSTNPHPSSINSYLSSSNLAKIPDVLASTLDEEFSLAEMDRVVGKLKTNKSPGWDGLTNEFYKLFWCDIRLILHQALSEGINSGTLSPSQRIGILTIIPKPKPATELIHLKNWRPITLLNIDYKILTHVIKNRLLTTIPTIIDNSQSGFQPGKSTTDNLILMTLTLEYFQHHEEEEGMIMQVDMEKAFDSVEHNFLYATLESMGFGEYIIKLIKVAFNGYMSLANVNGHLSSPVYLLRGLHQGSPLSPILFLIVAQVLTFKIQHNNRIKGLKISGVEILLSLFADDTDIFMQASAVCVEALFEELRAFGTVSGCNPNISKTKCIPLGKTRNNHSLISALSESYGPNFVVNNFTALGVDFSNSLSVTNISISNYNDKISKANTWISRWNRRSLSIYGKITIIKSLVLSQFSYLAIPLPRPGSTTMKVLSTCVFNFLWGGKRDKIKRDIVCTPVTSGGLDLFTPESFILGLKTSLVSKLVDNSYHSTWKRILVSQLAHPSLPIISIENGLVKNGCHYASDLLSCYSEWKKGAAARTSGSINHCIWQNVLITDIGSRLWNPTLINLGVLYIADFLTDSGDIMTYNDLLLKLGITSSQLSTNKYVDIKMALRRYDCPTNTFKSLRHVERKINLSFFDNKTVKGREIRNMITTHVDVDSLSPLKEWKRMLKRYSIDWSAILSNVRYNVCNNFILIQFHYKLMMRISTCKLMRWKMNIEPNNGLCRHCGVLESLNHIYFNCNHATMFIRKIVRFIRDKLESGYTDSFRYYFITCNHDNQIVNFVNLAAKWFISRQFQTNNDLVWDSFIKTMKMLLTGERREICTPLKPILNF